jgi:hypothetical protein
VLRSGEATPTPEVSVKYLKTGVFWFAPRIKWLKIGQLRGDRDCYRSGRVDTASAGWSLPDLLSAIEKPRPWRGFFLPNPLLSEYQVLTEIRPKFFERIKMEVVWNEVQNFSTVREKLDNFSTFGR